MAAKEAQARIRINKLLEEAGWRFFDGPMGRANIALEHGTKLTRAALDAFGNDFEHVGHEGRGYVDFLLLDERGAPLVVLEAKAGHKDPLIGKEQARTYAQSLHCRFVLLSNGTLHYFWDLTQGNPTVIGSFPTPVSIGAYGQFQPSPAKLTAATIGANYIAQSQRPDFDQEAGYTVAAERPAFLEKHGLRLLRPYQVQAVHRLQAVVRDEQKTRFLFEMATGTGKTLTAAAVIKLFLQTGNARRVLFLVDRLELEEQARKDFERYLKLDYQTVVYKEKRDDWRQADIVVTTVQSLLFNGAYRRRFSPTDFDLVISDEAHRSIGGNARAVFEYFVGYKLGLTATPKDYLHRVDRADLSDRDPRQMERRLLLDTYRTFGCESGQPTFRYSLLDGVRDQVLVNPLVVDARTDITTELLSEAGYAGLVPAAEAEDADGEEVEAEATFRQRDFEKKFFSEATNWLFVQTLLDKALLDPVSGEMGKTIVFAVSQHHAGKLTQLLNAAADARWPGRYQSDFAVQVTSLVPAAQQFTINFRNNNLLGKGNFSPDYATSKARVCVTVGMMTTGYDCPDLLNLALMRPVFSPSDFVQIKGRGTRRHSFLTELQDVRLKEELTETRGADAFQKQRFKLFDFFATCEYFEEHFDYDEIAHLPRPGAGTSTGGDGPPATRTDFYEHAGPDQMATMQEEAIGLEGMKIDRKLFERFETKVQADDAIRLAVEAGSWDAASDRLLREFFNKPTEFVTLDKLRRAVGLDRRLTVREFLEKAFGYIDHFPLREELLDDAFAEFITTFQPPETTALEAMRYFFSAYITDGQLRDILSRRELTTLNTNPGFTMADYKAVPPTWRTLIPEYVKDYVPLNRFL